MASEEITIRVECPFCGWEQNTHTTLRVKCMLCEKSYTIFPKENPSRVTKLVKGTQYQLNNLYYKQRAKMRK